MIVHILKMCTFFFVHVSYFFSDFKGRLNLDIFPAAMLRGCLVCVICNSNIIHSFIFKLLIMIVHTLHIENVHLVFCARFIIFFSLLMGVELTATATELLSDMVRLI